MSYRRSRRRDKIFQLVNIHGWFKKCDTDLAVLDESSLSVRRLRANDSPLPQGEHAEPRGDIDRSSPEPLAHPRETPPQPHNPGEGGPSETQVARLNYPLLETPQNPMERYSEGSESHYNSPFTQMIDQGPAAHTGPPVTNGHRRTPSNDLTHNDPQRTSSTGHRRTPSTESQLYSPQGIFQASAKDERSEEEQLKLAMALSLSDNSRHSLNEEVSEEAQLEKAKQVSLNEGISEEAQLEKAKQVSLQPVLSSGAAESLSWSLFINTCLGWDDKVVDGLYDVVGQFPEILEIAPDSGVTKQFPSLEELKQIPYTLGDAREVIVIDRDKDPVLNTIEWKAADAIAKVLSPGPRAQAKAIMRVVIDSMGGDLPKESLQEICWEETQRLKSRSGNLVMLIGQLKTGLARHRALLFKTLADARRVSCKMIRGAHLRDEAAILVRLGSGVYYADLFSGDLEPLAVQSGASSRNISARPSAAEAPGLDWQSDGNEDPVLMGGLDVSIEDVSLYQSVNGVQGEGSSRAAGGSDSPGGTDPTSDGRERSSSVQRDPSSKGAAIGTSLPTGPSPVDDTELSKAPPSGGSHPQKGSETLLNPSKDSAQELLEAGLSPFQQEAQQSGELEDAEPLSGSYEFVPRDDRAHILPIRTEPVWRNVSLPSAVKRKDSEAPVLCNSLPALSMARHNITREGESKDVSHKLREQLSQGQETKPSEGVSQHGGDKPSEGVSQHGEDKTSERRSQRGERGSSERLSQHDDEEPIARLSQRGEKAHWKLRQLADLRPYSESAIRLYGVPRPQVREESALQERLEVLHEVQQLQLLNKVRHSSDSDRPLQPSSQVKPAMPLSAVESLPHPDEHQDECQEDKEADGQVDEFEISMEDLKKGPRIGHGSFGVVYKGTWLDTDVAIKELIVQDIYNDHCLKEEFERETNIMKRLRHVNVLLFLGVVTIPPHLAIVTQYMRRGSLYRILHRSHLALDSSRKRRMALDIARGMTYLHNCRPPIVHRDLKSDNLLVDYDFTVKVSDFGLSRVRRCTLLSGRSQAGTPHWTAPEVLRGQSYDESSDTYSFGVILWELLVRKPPWEDKTEIQVIGAVGFGKARLQIPSGADPELTKIISSCWDEPCNRPSFKAILDSLKELSTDTFNLQTTSEAVEETGQATGVQTQAQQSAA